MPAALDAEMSPVMDPADDSDFPLAGPAGRRLPRRLARLVRIDGAVVRVLDTYLDGIDRAAALPRQAVYAVNAALAAAAPIAARLPRRLRPGPFPAGTPVRAYEAGLALLRIHCEINLLVRRLLDPADGDAG